MNNLYAVISTIQATCKAHKLVNEFHNGDVYEYLNSGEHKYPCVVLTIQNLTEAANDMNQLSFSLFFIDRLRNDNANKSELHSEGLTILKQIVNRLEDYNYIQFTQKKYTFFEEKFADLCGGVYLEGTLQYPNNMICATLTFTPIPTPAHDDDTDIFDRLDAIDARIDDVEYVAASNL